MVPRFGPQGRSAFPGLVGKRFWDVWVGLGCLSGLPLAARTNSAERVEAMEACVPRFATGVLDGEIGAHLTHTAVDTRINISVIMPGYACFYTRRPSRRRSAITDDRVSANMKTPSFPTPFLVRLVLYLHNQFDTNWAHGVVVSHPLRMQKALGSNPSVSMHMCMHDNAGNPDYVLGR